MKIIAPRSKPLGAPPDETHINQQAYPSIMTISSERKKEIKAIRERDIDFTDISSPDAKLWANAEIREPDRTQHVTLRIKKSVLDHFKAGDKKGYQIRINAVLESYVRAPR